MASCELWRKLRRVHKKCNGMINELLNSWERRSHCENNFGNAVSGRSRWKRSLHSYDISPKLLYVHVCEMHCMGTMPNFNFEFAPHRYCRVILYVMNVNEFQFSLPRESHQASFSIDEKVFYTSP